MSNQHTQRQFIVSGFHRSGTSLTMQALVKAGLCAGNRLMPAHPSNPDGHYEDLDIVELHQSILQSQQRDWYTVAGAVTPELAEHRTLAGSIIDRLQAADSHWGFKDPRTCLFIDWWCQQLPDPAVVLVYRHYLACNRSLRAREAQDLILNSDPSLTDLHFWRDPHHGLKLWLSYNQALLSFIDQNPQQVLVVSYDALLSGFNLVECVNQRFGLTLNADCDTGIRQGSIGVKPQDNELPVIPQDLLTQLDSTLAALQALSVDNNDLSRVNTKSSSTAPIDSDDSVLKSTLENLGFDVSLDKSDQASVSGTKPGDACGSDSAEADLTFYKNHPVELEAALEAAGASGNRSERLRLAGLCAECHLENFVLQLRAGQTCLDIKEYSQATEFLQRAHALRPNHTNCLTFLGILALRQHHYEEALPIFEKLIAENPETAAFYSHAARCLFELHHNDLALEMCEQGLQLNAELVGLHLCKLDALMAVSSKQVIDDFFQQLLEKYPGNSIIEMKYSHHLAATGDADASRTFYYSAIWDRIGENKHYGIDVLGAVNSIQPDIERRRFQSYVLLELNKLKALRPGGA